MNSQQRSVVSNLANKTSKGRNRKQRPDSAKICNSTKENKASDNQFFQKAQSTLSSEYINGKSAGIGNIDIKLKSPTAAKKISNQRVPSPPVKRSQALSMTPEQVEIESLRAQVKALEARVAVTNDLECQVKNLTDQVNAAQKTNQMLHQTLAKENAQLADQVKEAHQQRGMLQKELKGQSKYISDLESRVYDANTRSLDLLKSVRALELESATLKNYIVELKARVAVYVPVKDDPVDEKMAEFINNYPDRNKLKIMFMRESEGVYEFGSKRVNVRIEKGRIKIRVGGGYLSIDEFLD